MAENMVFNSGFELGDSGYSIAKYLRPDTNPQLKYEKAVIDSSTFASGRQSIRIPNQFAEQGKILIGEFKLPPGVDYNFSFAAKSDSADCAINVFLTSTASEGWDVHGQEFRLEKNWKNYDFSFKTKTGWTQPYYSLRIDFCHSKDSKPGNIWFDSIQLSPGSQKSSFQPCADIEVCSRFEKSVIIIPDGGRQSTITTHAVNNTNKRISVALTVNMIEDHAGSVTRIIDGEKLVLATLNLDLAAHEEKDIKTKVDLKKYGAFRLDTTVKSEVKSASSSDYCVIVGNLERKLIDLDKTYCSGINFSGGGLTVPPNWEEQELPGYCLTMDQEEYIRMYSELGIRLFRDWDGHPAFTWKNIEPEQGKFDFRFADKTVDTAAKYGIRVLPVLGNSDFIIVDEKTDKATWPSWIEPLCRKEKKSGAWQVDIKIPPVELWRKYIRAVATHFKGRITHYEILNEGCGYLSPDIYMEFLKAAYEEIRMADSAAKIIGFCATADRGGELEGFLGECYKRGGLAYADFVSFHPYESYSLSSDVPADKQIDLMKTMLAKANKKDKGLWMTELYYLTDKKQDQDRGLCQPQDTAQRYLTDLGEGVQQSMPLWGPFTFKRFRAAHFNTSYARTNEHPSASISIYNTLTRLFEGAKPAKKFRWSNDTICYIYERNNKLIAAFWNYSKAKGLRLKLAVPDNNIQLYDLFGNNLAINNGNILITAAPCYIESGRMSRNEFISMLEKPKIEIISH